MKAARASDRCRGTPAATSNVAIYVTRLSSTLQPPRGHIPIFSGPGPNGAIQSGALADKCRLHEMLETVRFSLPGFEFLNNLISHALLPASQELRPEIGDVTKVPVETAAGYVQPG